MSTRDLVQPTYRRFLPLPFGPVIFSIAFVCLAFSSAPAGAITADLADYGREAGFREALAVMEDRGPDVCSQWISSGENDPPMLGMLVAMEWDFINQIYIGTYLMEGGDKPIRRFRCDTYQEL